MTPFLSRLILLLSLLLSSPSIDAGEVVRKYVAVEVRQGAVFVEGTRVTEESTLADYEALLGKADRVTNLKNTIHTYDALGIQLYQAPDAKTIHSISLDFAGRQFKFSPKETFRGVLIVDDQVLRGDFPRAGIQKIASLKYDPSKNPPGFGVARSTQEKIVLILEYLKSPQNLEGVGISWER